MPIYKGNTKIVKLYKGSAQIVKRYKGVDLIYSVSRLPSAFQEVEYIESTGTQYIDSALIPSITHSFSIKFSVGYLTNLVLFGSRTSGNYASSLNQVYLNLTSNSELKLFNIFGTNDLVLNQSIVANQIYDFNNFQNNDFRLSSPTQPYYIFALNNLGNASAIANLKLYSFKIYESNTLIRNFVPCYRKADNVAGLYDLVNCVFYTNAGTGTFIVGGNV